jgi:hypothetical protein
MIIEDAKKWYESGTIRSALVAIAMVVALIWNKNINVEDIYSLIGAVITLGASVYSIICRIRATKFIK